MKNIINYFYNLYPETIEEKESSYYFKLIENNYVLIKSLRPSKDLNVIFEIQQELYKNNVYSHKIVKNRFNEIYSKVEENNYVLLQYLPSSEKINLSDILLFSSATLIKNSIALMERTDWEDLWSKKIDYFEYQISQLGKNKDVILNSFSYYIGLGENAIAYAHKSKTLTKINSNLTINHRKMKNLISKNSFYNPLEFIIDYEIRDFSEYVKLSFFNQKDPWTDIETYFSKKKITSEMLYLFYARLLYPSYYFEVYEDIMEAKRDDQELLEIIDLADSYELFLKDIYNYLNTIAKMTPIDWIIKKDLKDLN